ncbi:MAG: acyltransferase [Gelidibacter sp.]
MIKNLLRIEISPKRIYGLDLLRAMAILFVVFHHGQYILPKSMIVYHELFIFDGVSIFFVLSGFLIGGILIKIIENQKATRAVLFDFWIRRWFRTLPNYFLILLVLTFYFLLTKENFYISNIKSYFIFSQNLYYEHPNFFPEAWSLSIEEWFYLLIPTGIFFLITFVRLKPKQSVLMCVVTIILLITIFRVYRYYDVNLNSYNDWNHFFRKQVITRLDSLMFGVIGAYIQFYNPRKWTQSKFLFLIIGVSLFIITKLLYVFHFIPAESFYNCVFSFTVTSLATLALLPFLSQMKQGNGFIHKGVTIISLISYSMYLINFTVVQGIIIKTIPWDSITRNHDLTILVKYGFFWLITVIGSILIYKYYEIPLTSLRDKKWVKKLAIKTK